MEDEKLKYERPALEMIDLDVLLCNEEPAGEGTPVMDPDTKTPEVIVVDPQDED